MNEAREVDRASVPAKGSGTDSASGRDELEAETGMDRTRLTLSKGGTLAGGYYERAARSFYEGVLGGRQVWLTGPRAAPRKLWFLVGHTLIQVSPAAAAAVLELSVDSPAAIAERCWDAGYTVRFRADDTPDFIVIDPFGREIVLIRNTSVRPIGAGAAG